MNTCCPTITDVPVACLLSGLELQERRRTVLAAFRSTYLEVRDVPDGYAFRFAANSAQLAALVDFMDLERQCCPFLRFDLNIKPAGGPFWLTLTGPEGTRTMLSTELGLVEAAAP